MPSEPKLVLVTQFVYNPPNMARPQTDPEVLRAALIGYEHHRSLIDEKIAEIKARLAEHRVTTPAADASAVHTKRTLSPAARRRIAAAQKKRWAAFHAGKGPAAKKAVVTKKASGKRVLSAAARKRIAAAQKKRWAAFRAKQAATAGTP